MKVMVLGKATERSEAGEFGTAEEFAARQRLEHRRIGNHDPNAAEAAMIKHLDRSSALYAHPDAVDSRRETS